MTNKLYSIQLALIALAVFASSSSAVALHPYHVSRAEVEYNAKRKTFEVALCIWPEDLQRAISATSHRQIDIDSISEAKRDQHFHKYVQQKFRVFPSNDVEEEGEQFKIKPAAIRWVGSELELKQGWLYFEVDAKAATNSWTIENEMFFELNDDQLNLNQLRVQKAVYSQTLSGNNPQMHWSPNEDRK